MVKSVALKSIILSVSVFIAIYVYGFKTDAISVFVGSVFGILNFFVLYLGISAFLNKKGAAIILLTFGSLRLFILITILFILLYLHLITLLGVLGGITIVYLVIMYVAMFERKKLLKEIR